MSVKKTAISCYLFLGLISQLQLGCGSDSNSSKDMDIDAPKIENTTQRGFVFAALSPDQSIGNSSIFRYDFKNGKITKILVGESSNPDLFLHESQVILFNRHDTLKNYKLFDPFADEINPKTEELPLITGDPIDVTGIGSDQLLLASPQSKGLQTLNTKTGTIQTLTFTKEFSSKSLRPLGLKRSGQNIYVIHSGLEISADGLGISDGSQQVYSATINGNSLDFNDLDPQTPSVDGSPLTATFPVYSSTLQNDEFKILGLCSKQIQNCKSGIDMIQRGQAKKIGTYEPQAAQYVDQLQPSDKGDRLWGLVSNAQDAYVVAQIDTTNGLITEELHRFTQKRIFGVKFEPESRTLFVGDADGDKSSLLVFRDGQKIASVDINGVFYRGVFIR